MLTIHPYMSRYILHICTFIPFILILLSSCGTSRKATSGNSGKPANIPQAVVLDDGLDDITARLLNEASTWLGVRYKYGGSTRAGTDCSGMVMQVFKDAAGISLPRSSREQHAYCKPIKQNELVEGDLVFFAIGKSSKVGHVGLYVGDRKMIHASTSRGVMISALDEAYWKKHYAGSGRIEAFEKRVSAERRRKKGKRQKKTDMPAKQASGKSRSDSIDNIITNAFQLSIDEVIDSVATNKRDF